MFNSEVFMDMNIRQLVEMLGQLISELEGVPNSVGIGMAREMTRSAIIKDIQWLDDVLDK